MSSYLVNSSGEMMLKSVNELRSSFHAIREQGYKIMYENELSYEDIARQANLNAWTVQRFMKDDSIEPAIQTLIKMDKWIQSCVKE